MACLIREVNTHSIALDNLISLAIVYSFHCDGVYLIFRKQMRIHFLKVYYFTLLHYSFAFLYIFSFIFAIFTYINKSSIVHLDWTNFNNLLKILVFMSFKVQLQYLFPNKINNWFYLNHISLINILVFQKVAVIKDEYFLF